MNTLGERLDDVWTTDDAEILSEVLLAHSSDGAAMALRLLDMFLLAQPDGAAVSRAALWMPGRMTVRRRDLIQHGLRIAAEDVGPIDVIRAADLAEYWGPLTGPRQRRALALLAEAAARGIGLPELDLDPASSSSPTCLRLELGTDPQWSSCLGLVIASRVGPR